jgi:pimeloyl-ACP methyl ester carboxylesterase
VTRRILYLHGFASGPSSKKAQFFQQRFAEEGQSIEIPDLAAGDFEHLTISGQLAVIERLARGEGVSLIGSSMGGYLAGLYAARHPEVDRVVLMAPAFRFVRRWAESLGASKIEAWKRTGSLPFFHYSEQRDRMLDYKLMEDGRQYEEYPEIRQPALIFHGNNDVVVPPAYSVEFAAGRPNVHLILLNSDHELTDSLEIMWGEAHRFLL